MPSSLPFILNFPLEIPFLYFQNFNTLIYLGNSPSSCLLFPLPSSFLFHSLPLFLLSSLPTSFPSFKIQINKTAMFISSLSFSSLKSICIFLKWCKFSTPPLQRSNKRHKTHALYNFISFITVITYIHFLSKHLSNFPKRAMSGHFKEPASFHANNLFHIFNLNQNATIFKGVLNLLPPN